MPPLIKTRRTDDISTAKDDQMKKSAKERGIPKLSLLHENFTYRYFD